MESPRKRGRGGPGGTFRGWVFGKGDPSVCGPRFEQYCKEKRRKNKQNKQKKKNQKNEGNQKEKFGGPRDEKKWCKMIGFPGRGGMCPVGETGVGNLVKKNIHKQITTTWWVPPDRQPMGEGGVPEKNPKNLRKAPNWGKGKWQLIGGKKKLQPNRSQKKPQKDKKLGGGALSLVSFPLFTQKGDHESQGGLGGSKRNNRGGTKNLWPRGERLFEGQRV